MRTTSPWALPIFRSDAQLGLLALLLLEPGQARTAAELEEATGLPPASVHRELSRALDAGIVVRDVSSRPHRYSAAAASPLFEPLVTLLDRTWGVEPRLRAELEAVEGIESAAIHGSWAKRKLTPASDVDVLVVGDVDGTDLRRRLRRLGRKLGRRIDLTLVSRDELGERYRQGDGFLSKLIDGPLTPLVGDPRGVASND